MKKDFVLERSREFDSELIAAIPYVKAYCVNYGAMYSDLDDILQEIHLITLQNYDKIKSDVKISTYMCSVARNIILQKRDRRNKMELISIDKTEICSNLSVQQNNEYDFKILNSVISEGLENIEGTRKRILDLYIDGYTVTEISKELNLTYDFVKTRLYHARVAIANALSTCMDKKDIISKTGKMIAIPVRDRIKIITQPPIILPSKNTDDLIIYPIAPGLLLPRRGEISMTESTYNYMLEIWNRFLFTKNIFFMDLQLSKIRKKHNIKSPYSCFINNFFLIQKKRVYSLKFPDNKPTLDDAKFIYEEFKEYERNKKKREYSNLTEEEYKDFLNKRKEKRNKNKEKINKRKRELHAFFYKDEDNERSRKKWEKNKDKYNLRQKEYKKQYYSDHKEELNKKAREYFKINKDAIISRRKELRHLKKQQLLNE